MKPLHHSLPILFYLFLLLLPGCKAEEPAPSAAPQEPDQPAATYDGTIIAVGDSLTAGLGVAEQEAWPALLEKQLQQEGYNWQVINGGISGETSSGTLRRIKWILAQGPEIVILETGANDGLRGIPITTVRENISEAVQMLQAGGVTVVLAGMQIIQNLGPEYTEAFAEIYPEIAEKQDTILIPFLLENVGGVAALNQADAIHPNAEGHAVIARTVYPYAVQAIEMSSP